MPSPFSGVVCQHRPEAVELVRRYGCITGGEGMARLAGLTHGALQYSLLCAWRFGLIRVYAVSPRTRAWCVDSLRQLAGSLNGGIAAVRVSDIASVAASLIERGVRYVAASRVTAAMGLPRGIRWAHDLAYATLSVAIGGTAEPYYTRHAGRGWIVVNPRAAVAALRRLAETGELPLEPVPPPPPPLDPRPRRTEYDGFVSVRLPREDVDMIDLLVRAGLYPSRSEVVREAIRRLLQRHRIRAGA